MTPKIRLLLLRPLNQAVDWIIVYGEYTADSRVSSDPPTCYVLIVNHSPNTKADHMMNWRYSTLDFIDGITKMSPADFDVFCGASAPRFATALWDDRDFERYSRCPHDSLDFQTSGITAHLRMYDDLQIIFSLIRKLRDYAQVVNPVNFTTFLHIWRIRRTRFPSYLGTLGTIDRAFDDAFTTFRSAPIFPGQEIAGDSDDWDNSGPYANDSRLSALEIALNEISSQYAAAGSARDQLLLLRLQQFSYPFIPNWPLPRSRLALKVHQGVYTRL